MMASGVSWGGYEASTESLSDPVTALTEDCPLSQFHGAVRDYSDGPLRVANKRSLLVLTHISQISPVGAS